MTHNRSLYCIRSFLFIFSSPTYGWCDTGGQQRTTILGVRGRLSWTGNHGNTALVFLIPRPCRQIPARARPIQHLHERKPPQSARCENTPGRTSFDGLFSCSISISHTSTDKQARLLFSSSVFILCLTKLLQFGHSRFYFPNQMWEDISVSDSSCYIPFLCLGWCIIIWTDMNVAIPDFHKFFYISQ